MDRRDFIGYLNHSAVLLAGGLSLNGLQPAIAGSRLKADPRLTKAYQLREQLAMAQGNMPIPEHVVNGDEQRYENLIASYLKGLPHNGVGEVDRKAYRQLIRALTSGKQKDFDAIIMGGPIRLANPQAALSYQLDG